MPSPVKPSQFKAVIVGPFSSICAKLKSFFNEAALFYAWFSYVYNEDGSFSDDFKADLCGLSCVGSTGGGGTSDGGGTGTTFGAPAINASYRAYSDKVRITWNAVGDATKYYIYRSTESTPLPSYYVGTTDGTTYDDTGMVAETDYNYWVRAVKADGTLSTWSNKATGKMRSAGSQLAAPEYVSARITNGTIEVFWAAVQYANTYLVSWSGDGVTSGNATVNSNVLLYNTKISPYFAGPSQVTTKSVYITVQAKGILGATIDSTPVGVTVLRTMA